VFVLGGPLAALDTCFESHMVHVRCKPVSLWLSCDVPLWQKIKLKLTKTLMIGVAKLNLVSMDQMNNEQIMEVISLEQIQRTNGEARKDAPSPNHIEGSWRDTKMYSSIGCFKQITAKEWKTTLFN
jgi:hypothetical protein